MSIENDRQLEASRRKLAVLEQQLAAVRSHVANPRVRDAIVRSLAGLINQFKEEIIRYNAGARRREPYVPASEQEVENTRRKLAGLEKEYERIKSEPRSPRNESSRRSLKRLINQMKEEIARFEWHAPVK